jgi:hypothetical protein
MNITCTRDVHVGLGEISSAPASVILHLSYEMPLPLAFGNH